LYLYYILIVFILYIYFIYITQELLTYFIIYYYYLLFVTFLQSLSELKPFQTLLLFIFVMLNFSVNMTL